MKPLAWGIWCLFFCSMAFLSSTEAQTGSAIGARDESVKVEEGQLFSVQKQVSVPPAAYPAVKLYLQSLVYSRPLPWPYYLEEYDVRDGQVTLRGRMLNAGVYEIPLGVMWWGGKQYVIPSFSPAVAQIVVPKLSAADLLLPFPEEALLPTPQNMQVEDELLAHNQARGLEALYWQGFWRHAFITTCFILVCVPCAFQLLRWWQVKRRLQPVIPVVTPGMVFREVKDLQQSGMVPWSKLVYVLNLVMSGEMPSLTSYELEQRFAAAGEDGLARACALIENYGYSAGGDEYFTQTAQLVEKELAAKNLL